MGTGGSGGTGAVTYACSAMATWQSPQVIMELVTQGMDMQFLSVTPDETAIAWSTGTGMTAQVNVADRPTSMDMFSTVGGLPPATGVYFPGMAALSFDGRRLVLVNSTQTGFFQYQRGAEGANFAMAYPQDFANISGLSSLFRRGEYFADPVLSLDDSHFFYSDVNPQLPDSVQESVRMGDVPWPGGNLAGGTPLQVVNGKRKQIVGVSSDNNTLFYVDTADGSGHMVFRAPGLPFSQVVNLPMGIGAAAPNQACTRIYFSTMYNGNLALAYADRAP